MEAEKGKRARMAAKCFTIIPPQGKGTTRSFCVECVNGDERLPPLLLDAHSLGILEISEKEEEIAERVCDLCGRPIQTVIAPMRIYTTIIHFTFDEATTTTTTSGLEAQLRALELLQRTEVTIHDKVTDAISQALNSATLRLVDASYTVEVTDATPIEGQGGERHAGTN